MKRKACRRSHLKGLSVDMEPGVNEIQKPFGTIIDFVTGNEVPNIGAEANRQLIEKYLVIQRGYAKTDIEVDVEVKLMIAGELYTTQIDLVVGVEGKRIMVIKCAAGSLGSREREIISAARLLESYQIPISVVTDGKNAVVLDSVSGKKINEGLSAIPSKQAARKMLASFPWQPYPKERLEREKLIFRSYDMMNVNVRRNISTDG